MTFRASEFEKTIYFFFLGCYNTNVKTDRTEAELMSIEKYRFEEIYGDVTEYFGENLAKIEKRTKEKYAEAVKKLIEKQISVSTAESFTGGLIGKLFTDVPGSSAIFYGGVIAYINEIKEGLLGVKRETIEKYTEVSFEAAREMAEGARRVFGSDIAISTTGFAGPTGGNESDPVGTVYVAIATNEKTMVFRTEYKGALLDRETIRTCSALLAVEQILIFLG